MKPDRCPHAALRRVGRCGRQGARIDLDCVDCTETVHEDVRGRTNRGASA